MPSLYSRLSCAPASPHGSWGDACLVDAAETLQHSPLHAQPRPGHVHRLSSPKRYADAPQQSNYSQSLSYEGVDQSATVRPTQAGWAGNLHAEPVSAEVLATALGALQAKTAGTPRTPAGVVTSQAGTAQQQVLQAT
jgi:hypothetical protein